MLLLWVVAGGGFFFVLGVEVAKVVDDRHPYTFVFLSTLRSTHPTSSKLDGPVVPSLTPSLQSYISSGYPRQAIFFITHCLSSCLFLAQHLAPPRHHHHHFVVRPRRFAPIGLYSTATRHVPAAATVRGRLPLGTPGHQPAESSNAHIRIVSHDNRTEATRGVGTYDSVATFQTASLQAGPAALGSAHPTANRPSTDKILFADMARRGHNDTFEGEDGPVTGPVSLARLVAAKNAPKRNRGNRTWRPLELSDLGEDEDGGIAMDSEKQDPAPKATPKLTEVEPFPALTPARATLSDLARIQTDFTMAPPASSKNPFTDSPDSPGEPELQRFPFPRVPRNDSYDASPTGARDAGAEEIHKVFGLLPDPFHLEQCTGENDGAVVFIGHPNRDVSAHQWSASAFQWVNIGLYSYTRRQIEGSLSKDRLKGQTIVKSITPNTLAYFKEVALQRQKTAEEDTRRAPLGTQDSSCQARNPQGLDFPWMEPTPQQAFREIYDIFYPPRNENQEALFGLQESQTAVFGLNPGPRPARRSLAIDDDDPFVSTPTKAHQAAGDMYNMSRNAYGEMDALDCGQKASSKLAGNHVHCLNDGSRNVDVNTQLYFQQEVEENQEDTKLQPRKLGPEDIQGGGETNKNTFTRPQAPLSPEDQHQRQKLIEKMANYPIPPAVPPYPPTRPSDADIRPVFATKMTGYEADIENSDSTTPESLKVSDPDGIAQPLVPQIAPGLKGLHPTQQNFKGPFFADSMPTTHDPTASLTFRDDEERKLRNWFTDGQRPARQEDFYKTMMSADAKAARTSRDFGAIGKPSPQALSRATDNTRIFIPLYETLQQYADEAQTGNRSYFTRAWIKPAAHLIDHGPDGNNSFFGLTSSVSVPRPMAPSRRLTAGFGLPIGTGFSVAGARDTRSPFIFPRNGN